MTGTNQNQDDANNINNQAMLLECFHENLNHARHVENERMMFITLFSALVGGAFGMLSNIESPIVNITVLIMLLMLNTVCMAMTERWGDVFEAHMLTAKRLYLLLSGFSDQELTQNGLPCQAKISHHSYLNQLYVFDQAKYEQEQGIYHRFPYIRTRIWFRFFNLVIMTLLVLSILYHAILFFSHL